MAQVTYTREGRIGRIQIDATAAGNRFDAELRRRLNRALLQYRDDDDAWVGVVACEGSDFCLGSVDAPSESYAQTRERAALWAGGYVEIWKPAIAAIQGQCRGEGLALALSCDLRIADRTASFAADFGSMPGDPDVLAAWLLNLVGISTTFELLWLEETLDLDVAFRLGLVNRIAVQGAPVEEAGGEGRFPMVTHATTIAVPNGDALMAGLRFAEELLQYAPVTRNFQKETAYRSIGVPFHFAQTLEVGPNPYASEDRIEGTRAFVENRRPAWTNR